MYSEKFFRIVYLYAKHCTFQSTELLRVRVAKGERLGKRDLFGVVSPYCVVRLEKADGEQIDEITLEKKKKV
ncbi:unnamed protein product [Strongylus vulgaris]|uniref:Uncharacterized protein n=1 Tax=Strongylus vulgaris TaxID=40348 RepID=A0A3P7J843_STRVU|nr:unnamed protein product [Strongylus vulgaris]